ncbi:hypothetical protein OSB04_un001196 [Centaurea solstitialis]|uniref:WRKY domain-containing protein n=1 Tax=Centaurea solstitialis TaxID=347529 RepID=A0AA38SM64_9ASTR|nr:hypothetical protein OSB04_un001196 [Centaurea solstitialis]
MSGLNDWDWHAMANGFCPTIDASSSSFAANTTTLMPTIPNTAVPVNNEQMMDGGNDWGLHAAVNNFSQNTVASLSSFAPITATFNPAIPTAQTIHINNSQMIGGVNDWGVHETVNESYPSFAGSSSSFSFSFSSSTYSANPAMNTTIPLTTTAMHVPTSNYNQQNTSFPGEMSNQHHPMNISNIKQMLQNSNYLINVPKIQNPSISNKNLAVLSHPNHGNTPTVSKYHQAYPYPYPQHRYQPPPQQNQLQINQQTIRVSEHVNSRAQLATKQSKAKTKRVYKMPVQGLNTDKLSWKKYGAKLIDGSQYPRVYYKCTVTKDCKVRRKVELNRSDPNTLIVTYSGDHNHLPPYAGNVFASNTSSDSINNHNIRGTVETNHPNFSNTISSPTMLSFGRKKAQKNRNVNRDEDIFGGLEDFIPL